MQGVVIVSVSDVPYNGGSYARICWTPFYIGGISKRYNQKLSHCEYHE